jgi:D-alanyl-D-alanine carboxypeptidase
MRVASTHRRLLLAVLAGVIMLSAGETPRPTQAVVAPACGVGDTLTRYRATSDWYRSLLDTRFRLPRAYAPGDLVSVSRAGVAGFGRIRRVALGDFAAMARAAKAARSPFAVQSAYRGYGTQISTFWRWVSIMGYRRALLASARPGHSEHQLGTAVDLKTPGGAAPWAYADWGRTRAGAWLARNSWRYGWILSYPRSGSPGRTCYKYEPWHFRYVGRRLAAQIHASGLTPREWLWRSGATGTWTEGGPVPTPSPTPTVEPTPTPTATAVPTPSPTPTAEPTPMYTAVPTPTATPTPTLAIEPTPTPEAATP